MTVYSKPALDLVVERAAKAGFDEGWNRALEEAAVIADSFACGACGMDGKAAAAIRGLLPNGQVIRGSEK